MEIIDLRRNILLLHFLQAFEIRPAVNKEGVALVEFVIIRFQDSLLHIGQRFHLNKSKTKEIFQNENQVL